jgi:hypothetical protein
VQPLWKSVWRLFKKLKIEEGMKKSSRRGEFKYDIFDTL